MFLNLRTFNGVLRRTTGLALYRQTGDDVGQGFALHEYKRADGSFDYNAYRHIQNEGNKRKVATAAFVKEENIECVSKYIKCYMSAPNFGLCHGTRRGVEQQWFTKYLGCEVLGTEISDTAAQFPNTIQWDFHEVKPQWIGAVDFIYSNSFDHSYDPEKSLSAWMSCLTTTGLCFIEHSAAHGADSVNELDPFGADIAMMPLLIARWAKGRYALVDLLNAPKKHGRHTYFIVVKRTAPEMPPQVLRI